MGQAVSLNREGIAGAFHREIGLSRADAARLVDDILEHITVSLVEGVEVKIAGFGTFYVRSKNARLGRNPLTGEETEISARRTLSFRASAGMRRAIANAPSKVQA